MDEVKAKQPKKLPEAVNEALHDYVKHMAALALMMLTDNVTARELPKVELDKGKELLLKVCTAYDESVADLNHKLEQYKVAHDAYSTKTDWLQLEFNNGTLGPGLLGLHRADILTQMVGELRVSSAAAYGAGFAAGKKAAAS